MPLTITITRYTEAIDNEDVIPDEDKDVTVHTWEHVEGYSVVDQAVSALDDESWEPSIWPIDSFRSHDWISARYPHVDDLDVQDVVVARFSPDWPLAEMREVVRRLDPLG